MSPSPILRAIGVCLFLFPLAAAQDDSASTRPAPLSFLENRGQWDVPQRFVAARGTSQVRVGTREIVLSDASMGSEVTLRFRSADENARVVGEGARSTKHAFLIGERTRWADDVRSFASVRIEGVRAGIDVRVRESSGTVEYDLLLEGHARVEDAILDVEGARPSHIDESGALILETPSGLLRQPAPVTWHVEPDGTTSPVTCRYRILSSSSFGFVVEARDPGKPLVIDPRIEWGSYLSARASSAPDRVKDVHVRPVPPLAGQSASENDRVVTVVGTTINEWFIRPTGGNSPHPAAGRQVIFVSVFDRRITSGMATGSEPCVNGPTSGCWDQLVFSVLFGPADPNGTTVPTRIDVDENGVVTIAGWTTSSNFPVTPGAYDGTFGGSREGFLMRIDPSQPLSSAVLYSTFIGGSGSDEVRDVAHHDGKLYAVVSTNSTDLITTPNAYATAPIGNYDLGLYVLDLSRQGPMQADYVSYFGSDEEDDPRALTLETPAVGTPRMLLGGRTLDGNDPVTNPQTWPIIPREPLPGNLFGPNTAFMPRNSTGAEGFFARLDPSIAGMAGLLYSTYIGASGNDAVNDIAVTPGGRVFLGGETTSSNFPDGMLYGDVFSQSQGGTDGFVLEITEEMRDPTRGAPNEGRNGQVPYYTYFGANGEDRILRLATYSEEAVLVAGLAEPNPGGQTDFPTTAGAFREDWLGMRDAFLSLIHLDRSVSPPDSQVPYSTLMGGSRQDGGDPGEFHVALSHVLGDSGSVLALETLSSIDFPTSLCTFLPNRCEQTSSDIHVSQLRLPQLETALPEGKVRIDDEIAIVWDRDLSLDGATQVTGDRVSIDWSLDGGDWVPLAGAQDIKNDGSHVVRIPCPPTQGLSPNTRFRVRSERYPLFANASPAVPLEPLATDFLVTSVQIKKKTPASKDAFAITCTIDPNFDVAQLATSTDFIKFYDNAGLDLVSHLVIDWTGGLGTTKAKGVLYLRDDPTRETKGKVSYQYAKGTLKLTAKRLNLSNLAVSPFVRIRVGNLETRQRLPEFSSGGTSKSQFKLGRADSAPFYRGHLFVQKAKFQGTNTGELKFKVQGTLAPPVGVNCPPVPTGNTRLDLRLQNGETTVLTSNCQNERCVATYASATGGVVELSWDLRTGRFALSGTDPGLRIERVGGRAAFVLDVLIDDLPTQHVLLMRDTPDSWKYPSR